ANDIVGRGLQRLAGVGGCGRHRDDDAGGLLLSQRLDGGSHRGSVGQTIVDQNDGPTAHVWRRVIAPIEPLAPRQLVELAIRDSSDLTFWNVKTVHDLIVQKTDPAGL